MVRRVVPQVPDRGFLSKKLQNRSGKSCSEHSHKSPQLRNFAAAVCSQDGVGNWLVFMQDFGVVNFLPELCGESNIPETCTPLQACGDDRALTTTEQSIFRGAKGCPEKERKRGWSQQRGQKGKKDAWKQVRQGDKLAKKDVAKKGTDKCLFLARLDALKSHASAETLLQGARLRASANFTLPGLRSHTLQTRAFSSLTLSEPYTPPSSPVPRPVLARSNLAPSFRTLSEHGRFATRFAQNRFARIIRNWNPYFVSGRQADSRESLELSDSRESRH